MKDRSQTASGPKATVPTIASPILGANAFERVAAVAANSELRSVAARGAVVSSYFCGAARRATVCTRTGLLGSSSAVTQRVSIARAATRRRAIAGINAMLKLTNS